MVACWTGALTGVGTNSGRHQSWALSLPTLWQHQSCAQDTVTSLGSQAVLLPAGTREAGAQWGAGQSWVAALQGLHGAQDSAGTKGRALALGSRVHGQLLRLPWVM